MRERWCKICGGWHRPEAWPHNCMPERIGVRSNLPAPTVIGDTIEPTQHPCDGKYYTSKAKFRGTTRAHGCTEAGNDPAVMDPKPFKKPGPDRKGIKAAVRSAASKVGLPA